MSSFDTYYPEHLQDVAIITLLNSDPCARSTASRLREHILKLVNDGYYVTIDFKNIFTVSQSWADELLSVMCLKLGEDKFFDKVKYKNLNNFTRSVIAKAFHERGIEAC